MTVTTLNSTYSTTGNGVLKTFSFNFALLDEDHLNVYTITASGTSTLETDYIVNAYGDEGGSITFSEDATPASGATILFERNVPITQETDYLPNDPFPAEVHEDALDKLTMIVQDSSYNIDRAITVPIGDTATDLELPFATDRANKYLYFDSNGDVTIAAGTEYGDAYSISEVDALFTTHNTSSDHDGRYYTETEIDALFTDYYTSTEVDGLIIDYYNVVGDWNKQQYFGIATLTDAASISWNLDNAQAAQVTITGNREFANPTNQHAGASYMLKIIQDGSGSHVPTWDTAYKFEDDTDPVISSGAGEVSIIVFMSDGTNMYGTLQWKETL